MHKSRKKKPRPKSFAVGSNHIYEDIPSLYRETSEDPTNHQNYPRKATKGSQDSRIKHDSQTTQEEQINPKKNELESRPSTSKPFSIKDLFSFQVFKNKRLEQKQENSTKHDNLLRSKGSSLPLARSRTSPVSLVSTRGNDLPYNAASNFGSNMGCQVLGNIGRVSSVINDGSSDDNTTNTTEVTNAQYSDDKKVSKSASSASSTSSGYSSSPRSPKVAPTRIRRSKNPNRIRSSSELFPVGFQDDKSVNVIEELDEALHFRQIEITSEEDLTCPICLEIVYRPRQLACSHHFCLLCLQNYANTCRTKFTCPSCRQTVRIPSIGVRGFARNHEIEKNAEKLRKTNQLKSRQNCIQCQSDNEISICQHCRTNFCDGCKSKHLTSVTEEIDLLKQRVKLLQKTIQRREEHEEEKYAHLEEQIRDAAHDRINHINDQAKRLTEKVHVKRILTREKSSSFSEKVDKVLIEKSTYNSENCEELAKLHTDLTQLLSSVPSFKESQLAVDLASLSLSEVNSSKVPQSIKGYEGSKGSSSEEEDSSFKDYSMIYRVKSSLSKSRWGSNICGRPTGIAVSPWSGHLFVTGSDACKVFIFDCDGKHLRNFGSRGHGDGCFLCPAALTFNQLHGELLVTDKWKHCILAFDQTGNFLRQIGYKGRGLGQFSSPEGIATDSNGNIYVADTCNNRVQVLDSDGLFLREIGGITPKVWEQGWLNSRRELIEPAAVAVSDNGQRVYVADSEEHRIKVFDGTSGKKLLVFGSHGTGKGQFESPEAVAVDTKGYILVGDSGNGRIQVFKPNGQFVRYLGARNDEKGEFGWVSGVSLTKDANVVVTDFQNSHLAIF